MKLAGRLLRAGYAWNLAFLVAAALALVAAVLTGHVDLTTELTAVAGLLCLATCLVNARRAAPSGHHVPRPGRPGAHPVHRLRASDPGVPGRAWPRAPGQLRAR